MGEEADWFGDNSTIGLAKGERNARHDGLDAVWHDAAAATTVTPLKKLTKGDRRDAASVARAKAVSAEFNGTGKIADGAQPGAAPGGKALVRETKCYAPLHQSLAGAGDRGGIRPLGRVRGVG